MSAAAHVVIEAFFAYMAVYTWKRDTKLRTYAAVCKTAAYDATQAIFKKSNGYLVNFSCRMVLEW